MRRGVKTGVIGAILLGLLGLGAVPLSGRCEDLEEADLIPGFEALLPQLDDVDATREDGVEEVLEIAFTRSGVGAQVEPGVGQPGP